MNVSNLYLLITQLLIMTTKVYCNDTEKINQNKIKNIELVDFDMLFK